MMDMLTDPGFVEESVRRLLPIYKQTQAELFDLVKDNNDGSIHSWMHLWAPQRLAQMQCDLSVMISSEMFNRFVMPELEELCQFLDYPVYHLDGQEQIRHLDSLLSLKNLRAIQWTHVQSQPPTKDFVPVFQKIQKAGKNLVLKLHKQDVLPVLDQLSCRGLQIHVFGVDTDEEAMDLLKQIENHSKDRTF
jgi:succinate dehydrogenase flavin-adding protein (antitoxin of CptAB toxin-antitoxin module)